MAYSRHGMLTMPGVSYVSACLNFVTLHSPSHLSDSDRVPEQLCNAYNDIIGCACTRFSSFAVAAALKIYNDR